VAIPSRTRAKAVGLTHGPGQRGGHGPVHRELDPPPRCAGPPGDPGAGPLVCGAGLAMVTAGWVASWSTGWAWGSTTGRIWTPLTRCPGDRRASARTPGGGVTTPRSRIVNPASVRRGEPRPAGSPARARAVVREQAEVLGRVDLAGCGGRGPRRSCPRRRRDHRRAPGRPRGCGNPPGR
jgi:hypothetical protein